MRKNLLSNPNFICKKKLLTRSLAIAGMLLLPFMGIAQTGSVGIGTTIPNEKAVLDIVSTSKGILIPRLGQFQIDSLKQAWGTNTAVNGMLVYNTGTRRFNFWLDNNWYDLSDGPMGPQGPQGIQGLTGPAGPTGPQGAKGDPFAFSDFTPAQLAGLKGDKGDTGPAGPQGIQGPAGPTGAVGPQGATGPQGPAGPQGDPFTFSDFTPAQLAGLKGDKGDTGAAGPQGIQGPAGSTGAMGPQGPAGATGPQGPAGPKGDPFTFSDFTPAQLAGLKGDKGDTGAAGPQGIQGPAGPTGAMGPQGPAGATGPQGIAGPKGDPFTFSDFTPAQLAGLKGDKGDTGSAGPQGPQGAQGVAGPQGAVGPAGATGPAGTPGEDGATWFTGSGAPDASAGKQDGDLYLDLLSGDVFERTSGSWIYSANIKGPISSDSWSRGGNNAQNSDYIGTNNSTDLNIKTNGATRITVRAGDGSVGVGTATPLAKLDINGNVKLGQHGTILTKVLKTTVSGVDLAVIPAQTSLVRKFTVTNALPASTVMVSPAAALPDGVMIAYSRVSAVNEVEVSFFNASSVDQDPLSMSFYITVVE